MSQIQNPTTDAFWDSEGKPNRILKAVDRMEKQIAKRIQDGLTTHERVAALKGQLDMDFEEFCKFQELKTLAFAEGKITLDEASTIYAYLGDVPDWFNNQPVAVKSVLTSFFKELLEMRVSNR